MQIKKIFGTVMEFLPKTEGVAGRIHLGEKQIGELLKRGGSKQEVKALKALVGDLVHPSVDIAYKTKSNYTIAGLILNEGKDVVGRTAISVVNAGGKNTVVKARASLGKGIYANGFIDAGQTANSRDMVASLSRKGCIVKADATISKAAGAHVQLDDNDLGTIALVHKLPNGKELFSKYCNLQQGLDQAMRTAREWLSGGGAIPKSSEPVAKVAEKVESKLSKTAAEVAEKIKPFSKPTNKVTKSIIEKSSAKKINPKLSGEEKLTDMRGFKPIEEKLDELINLKTLDKTCGYVKPENLNTLDKKFDELEKINSLVFRKPKAFKINEFGEAEYIKAAKALKGKSATKARTAAERFKEAFGVTRRTYMNRLKKAKAAGDDVTFEKLRAEMGQKGYQPYFDRKTGALKIMEGARNIDDVARKLGLA